MISGSGSRSQNPPSQSTIYTSRRDHQGIFTGRKIGGRDFGTDFMQKVAGETGAKSGNRESGVGKSGGSKKGQKMHF